MRLNDQQERQALLILRDRALQKLTAERGPTPTGTTLSQLASRIGLAHVSQLAPTWHYPATVRALQDYLSGTTTARLSVCDRVRADVQTYPGAKPEERATRIGCALSSVYRCLKPGAK